MIFTSAFKSASLGLLFLLQKLSILMNQQDAVTFDQALLNMDKILAHILVEADARVKGAQIGQGWSQLKCIKQAFQQLGFFDKRKYKKQIQQLEDKLLLLEDEYIAKLELELAMEDIQKLNDLASTYKGKVFTRQKQEIREKMTFVKSELQRIIKKNQHRWQNSLWQQVLQESTAIVNSIDNILKADNETQMKSSTEAMNNIFQTIRWSKRIVDEEEEELMLIVEKLEELRKIFESQQGINMQIDEQGRTMDQADQNFQKVNDNNQETLQTYKEANNFVKMRRRTKIKLFFQGIFAAIGSLGGSIGAVFGLGVGSAVGSGIANQVQRQSTI